MRIILITLSALIFSSYGQTILAETAALRNTHKIEEKIVEGRTGEIVFQKGPVQITLPRTNFHKRELSPRPKTSTPSSPRNTSVKSFKSNSLAPAILDTLFNKVIEVKDGKTAKLARYKRLVSALPADAARWILEMGQFIEDRKISEEEKKLLEHLVHVKDPLVYLTSPRIMDGVTEADVSWARSWSPRKGKYLYLDEDLTQLDRLLKSDIRLELKNLVDKSINDFEIRKGLYLIFNYGHPPGKFLWSRYNTQLLMLCYLLKYGIPEGQERLALAAALNYGSVLTISQRSLWPRIIEFVRHRLNHISEALTQFIDNTSLGFQALDLFLRCSLLC